jgi:hypothetical protein
MSSAQGLPLVSLARHGFAAPARLYVKEVNHVFNLH